MQLLKTVSACCDWSKKCSSTIGFVPTMGALHAGHLSLVKQSLKACAQTIVSIYINPAQFSPVEDLSSYPKMLDVDIAQLEQLNVDAVFIPNNAEVYPQNEKYFDYKNDLFHKLEGKSRPLFFYGVTKVVARFFNIIAPSHAFFGEKDFQQLLIIKKMIKDLNYNIKLVSCPTIRDNRGLALSSRNSYLSMQNQKEASLLYKSLLSVKVALNSGEKNVVTLKKIFNDSLRVNTNFKLDYISVASSDTLNELETIHNNALISTAAFFKKVRLIDNVSFQSST